MLRGRSLLARSPDLSRQSDRAGHGRHRVIPNPDRRATQRHHPHHQRLRPGFRNACDRPVQIARAASPIRSRPRTPCPPGKTECRRRPRTTRKAGCWGPDRERSRRSRHSVWPKCRNSPSRHPARHNPVQSRRSVGRPSLHRSVWPHRTLSQTSRSAVRNYRPVSGRGRDPSPATPSARHSNSESSDPDSPSAKLGCGR